MNETEFVRRQQAWQLADQKTQTFKTSLDCRYQAARYARKGERDRLDQMRAASQRAADRFTDLLRHSPRDWTTGVPLAYLRDSLTFADATTRGQLQTIPPPAWGYTERMLIEFSWPIAGETLTG